MSSTKNGYYYSLLSNVRQVSIRANKTREIVEMKILLANKFYYRRGGDCVVTMNLERLLKAHGHEVAVYAMNYPENEVSEWSKYWPSNMTKTDALVRPFGSIQVRLGFKRLLDDFKPDVVHLHNIHTQLSPVIAEIAHKNGFRVVWTLHDTKLVCPCYTCMRDGHWCEECIYDSKAVIRHRCMPGGLVGSTIGYLEAKKWNKKRIQKYTDLFLPPSQFMMNSVVEGGYDAGKFRVLCNFIDVEKVKNPMFEKKDYYVFLGRLNEVKGIRTLCKAAKLLPYKLIVIGGGELLPELQEQYKESNNIEFKGQMEWNDFRPIIERARFMVIPSEWSENNPLTVIESQSLGTPVLGARIGGIPELITSTQYLSPKGAGNGCANGMVFESGNVVDLKEKIRMMWSASFDYKTIAENAVKRYSSEAYYEKLMEYYNGSEKED